MVRAERVLVPLVHAGCLPRPTDVRGAANRPGRQLRAAPPRPAGGIETVLRVLRVLEHAMTWGNSQNLEGHPDGWPVLGVPPLSNSLSTCTEGGDRAATLAWGRASELVLQRFSLGHRSVFL